MSAVQDLLANYQHIIDHLEIKMGSKGVFDIKVDGELLYSKRQTGRHAEPGEVLRLFKELVGPEVPTYPQDH